MFDIARESTATAPAATLMVIHQYKARGALVDILLPVVAFDDAVGLIVFAISSSVAKVIVSGEAISIVTIVLIPLLEIIGSLAVGFVLGYLMHLIMKFFRSRSNHIIVIIAFTLLGVGVINALNTIKINDINDNFETDDGNQITNGEGVGAVYAFVIQNDVTIDPIPMDIEAGDTYPTNPSFDTYFIKINEVIKNGTTYKTATLMKYIEDETDNENEVTGRWETVLASCEYKWIFRDKNNHVVTINVPYQDEEDLTKNQCIYIDGSLINEKITIDVEVTIS